MNARALTGLCCGLALVSALLLAGCTFPSDQSPSDGVADGGGQSGGTGTLRVVVTDKPFPFEFISQALVTITSIEVRVGEDTEGNENDNGGEGNDNDGDDENENDNGVDNANENENDGDDDNDNSDEGNDNEGDDENDNGDEGNDNADDDDDNDGSFIIIFEGQRVLNLLDLQNGRTDLLAEADIPAGTYTQMRLIVTAGEITLTDDRVFPLEVPSGEQSGIKLHFTFTVEADQETVLLLDIDLSKAFKRTRRPTVNASFILRGITFKLTRVADQRQKTWNSGNRQQCEGRPADNMSQMWQEAVPKDKALVSHRVNGDRWRTA